ncbi:dynamin-related protein 4C-like [Mercurialis annua]|uniref:dynamin-related protein 4C-like n=1 Tax=Mercurialis annua TaxID=3986 RepID=UPI0024AE2468|nr:dynamin-related protein 4C-like [Mercurialis annua]
MKMGGGNKSSKKPKKGGVEPSSTGDVNIISSDGSLVSLDAKDVNVMTPAPIVSSFNDRIRPCLDAVDKLRRLMVMKEGIQLPTIVVVGDQSSGKSSVLESLAGISLPRGQGICTRLPLIMRLQHHHHQIPQLSLEFNGKSISTNEGEVADAINIATGEIAGNGKGISNTPLTLVVKKFGVPDLTMVDLPGITRVPVHGQPENIYEQIADIIMEYIKPEESIILNVLSATVDFTTCESIRMSQKVDKTGERTLAVVTKADKAPEGLLEKITADDVNIGLGYVCVRNRIGDESYNEARNEETRLFESHHLLSKIDKSMVGIHVLAQNLMQIQATIIYRCLPEIMRKVDDKLNANIAELSKMPRTMSSITEAMTVLMGIIGAAKDSLRKILLRGEFDEYPDDQNMHCSARLVEMLNQYSIELHNYHENELTSAFLVDEIRILEEAAGISLPNFLPHSAFREMLMKKVTGISNMPVAFVEKVWKYIEDVVASILKHHSENYHQLQYSTRRACQNIIANMKEQFINWVEQMVQMEKLTDYTCNSEYLKEWNLLMAHQQTFLDSMQKNGSYKQTISGLGEVSAGDLRKHQPILKLAFDLKMRVIAYWKIVLWRLVDNTALHLQYCIQTLVNREMEKTIIEEVMSNNGSMERILEESPCVAGKREKLKSSIKILKESKEVLSEIMDKITFYKD